MNKLFLIFNGRFPDEKAASIFAVKSCESFTNLDLKVVLIVPRRRNRSKDDFFFYYGVKNNFKVVFLPTLDFFGFPFVKYFAFYINLFFFSISSFIYLVFRAKKDDVIYSNETLILFMTSFVFSKTLFEVHDYPENKKIFYKILFKRLKWILSTNQWKKEKLQKDFCVNPEKIIYEPNAVDLDEFKKISKNEARNKLGFPLGKKIVVYGGHLYSWKGVDTLAESTSYLPEEILIVFAGGTDKDTKRFKNKYGNIKNILIVGHVDRSNMFYWQKMADILILPNTAKENISKYYTSPMKLFDYMATNNPIISSDLPSITEILTENNAILAEADNPKSFAEKIIWAFENNDEANERAKNAFMDVQKYTWQSRAERIINFINTHV